MKASIYLKIFIAILFLILLPDFILSLSGRDTYLFYRYPQLVNIGIFVAIAGFVLVIVEIVGLLVKKNWIRSACYCTGALIFVLSCKISIGMLVEKSVNEARHEVEMFLMSKGIVENLAVDIEEDASSFYKEYIIGQFSKNDLQLKWKAPQYGRYEFMVSSKDIKPFMVRLSTLQNKQNEIRVYKIE